MEHVVSVGGVDAVSIVTDGDIEPSVVEGRGDLDGASFVGGVHGIENEVEEDLHDLVSDDLHLRQPFGVPCHDPFPLLSLVVLGDRECGIGHLVNVAQRGLVRSRPAEIDQFSEGSLNPSQLVVDHFESFAGVVVCGPSVEQLDERADGGQRVADFVSDPGGEQSERGVLFLLDEQCLRLLQFPGSFVDAFFEQLLVLLQAVVEQSQPASHALAQLGKRRRRPGDPAHQDAHQHHRGHIVPTVVVQAEGKQPEADRVHQERDRDDGWRIANGTDEQAEQVVEEERAVQSLVVGAEQADEDGFEQRDGQRPAAEKDPTAEAPERIEDGVAESQAEDGVEQQAVVVLQNIDQHEAEHQAEPADPQRDRLGRQLERMTIPRCGRIVCR